MAISPITQATGNLGFLNNIDTLTQPGITPSSVNKQTPAAQALATTAPPNPAGASALQSKSQGQYSNKQFIAPFSYSQNVEGTFINVDYLGKRIITNGAIPYRAIVSLSAITMPITLINDPSENNPDRLVKAQPSSTSVFSGTPIQNAAVQQYGTGINAVTNSLAGRTTQFTSLAQTSKSNPSQLFSNLASGGPAALLGQLQNKLPFSSINQSIANLPGFNVVTNALGNIPGGNNIASALSNPVGAVTGVLSQTLSNSINLQGGLPSASLGSLGDVFSLASNIASSGPPTSLTGIISLEQSAKSIICNFTLPIINIPPYDTILKFTFPKPQDILKQVKKQLDDFISNVINQFDIVKMLKNLLPDPHQIYEAIIKEITTCDKNPNNKNNAKNGQPSQGSTSTPSVSPLNIQSALTQNVPGGIPTPPTGVGVMNTPALNAAQNAYINSAYSPYTATGGIPGFNEATAKRVF
jgi:hypothetical protein